MELRITWQSAGGCVTSLNTVYFSCAAALNAFKHVYLRSSWPDIIAGVLTWYLWGRASLYENVAFSAGLCGFVFMNSFPLTFLYSSYHRFEKELPLWETRPREPASNFNLWNFVWSLLYLGPPTPSSSRLWGRQSERILRLGQMQG